MVEGTKLVRKGFCPGSRIYTTQKNHGDHNDTRGDQMGVSLCGGRFSSNLGDVNWTASGYAWLGALGSKPLGKLKKKKVTFNGQANDEPS